MTVKRIILWITGSLAFCLVVGAISAFIFINHYIKSSGPLKENTVILIPAGSSLNKISSELSQNGIIDHPELFSIMVRLTDSANKMKAGEYEFTAGMTPVDIFKKIASGEVVSHKITFAEGLMTIQILDALKNEPLLTGDIPDGIKEGELLPETYEFNYGDSRADIVNRMKLAMQNTVTELWEKRKDGLPIKTINEAITLASIVEKETGIDGERGQVASVFINRLKKRMRLQSDPTTIYAITRGEYVLERPLIFKDLEIKSEYNTYKIYGLPPTPIANPGRASLEAVLNPPDTGNYYFVADGTGGHKFSSTLDEHNRNVRKWRKISSEAKGQN